MTSQMLDEESDGRLMRRFAEERDERAFALLVERRGALVLGVCARMLRNRADADDAFQAVFLVAARRAAGLRRYSSLAGWLHNVAVRVSLNVLRANRRRHRQVQEAAEVKPEMESSERLEDLRQCIDEELAALPARLREVVVLCDLEDRTRGEVARLLSIPASTVTDRLHRGRELMRKRLIRRGLTVAAGGAAFGLVWCGSTAPAVSADLVRETVRNADAFTWGTEALRAELNLRIVTLAEGALQAMLLAQWKVVVCFAVVLAASMLGGAMVPSRWPLALHSASAGPFFLDDFEDGSAIDGIPVTWAKGSRPSGEFYVENGSLVLDPQGADGFGIYAVGTNDFHDGVIRTTVRMQSGGFYGVGLFARSPDATSLMASLTPDGAFELGLWTDPTYRTLARAEIELDPVNTDINIEYKLQGNELSMTAWSAGSPKPNAPQIIADASEHQHTAGSVGLYVNSYDSGKAYFRFYQSVPEPCTNYLAASMIGFTGFGLLFQRWRWQR